MAELFLNRAEAYAMLEGQEEKAVENLRALRSKRYVEGTSLEIVDSFKGLTGKELVDFIRQERRRELCFEGHRWFDLVRTGTFIKRMKEHSTYEAKVAEKNKTDIASNIKDYMILMPIPQRELDLNPELTQNPGWS